MTQLSSSASGFRVSGNDIPRSPTWQDGVFLVSHRAATPTALTSGCKVCEANLVTVVFLPGSSSSVSSGALVLSCDAGGTTHGITSSTALVPLTTSAEFSTGLQDSFALTADKSTNDAYADAAWPSAMPWPFWSGSVPSALFYEQTLTSTLRSSESYVSTTRLRGVFFCHAGVEHSAAGYMPAEAEYQVVMFASDSFTSNSSYVDANPFYSPEFTVTATTASQSFGSGSTAVATSAVSVSGQSSRLGRLDGFASGFSGAAPQDRTLQSCDWNDATLGQRKVERNISRNAGAFTYSNAIELQVFDSRSVFNAGQEFVFVGGSLTAEEIAHVQNIAGNTLDGLTTITRSQPVTLSLGTRHPLRFPDGPFLLRHELPDGRKTLPNEWHFFGNQGRAQVVSSGDPFGVGTTRQLASNLFATQAQANARQDVVLASDFLSGNYLCVGFDVTQTFRKVQLRASIAHNSALASNLAIVRLDYRFTAIHEIRLKTYAIELIQSEVVPSGSINLPWQFRGTYRISQTSESACTRRYVQEISGVDSIDLSSTQWREQAMAGVQVRKLSASGFDFGVRVIQV